MDVLKAEIAKKRKQLEEKELLTSNKRYFKRADLVAKELEEYKEKYGVVQYIENDYTKNIPQTALPENDTPEHILARHEVISRLRERGEPILLFGESEIDSFKRLRHCEILEPEVDRGFRNDFQEAMETVDQAYLDELLGSAGENKDENKGDTKSDVESDATYDDIKEMAKKMGCGDREHDMNVITKFIELMLKMWNDRLQNRNVVEKRGTKGKLAGAIYTQTKVYLKPLLKKLKTYTLPEDISDSLTEIVEHLLNRNYLKILSKFEGSRVIRVMPNTPMMVGEGCSAYCPGQHATDHDIMLVKTILELSGICQLVPESMIDAIGALAGSGPAFIYLIIEAMSDGGVKMGIPRTMATSFAAQTVLGAAKMVLETEKHTGVLKDEVCSPGGTTITGIHALETGGVRAAIMNAIEATTKKSEELGHKK